LDVPTILYKREKGTKMSRHQFNQLSPRERYEYLQDTQPDDYMGDTPRNLPTPAHIALLNFDAIPLPYQRAIEAEDMMED
jgi:hypothetical protein